MALSPPNYYVLLRILTVLIFSVSISAHENNSQQQALFRQATPNQKVNDEKVEILHPPTSGNNSGLNTRYYSGEFSDNKHHGHGSSEYFNPGLTNHNYYQQQNPLFIPSYGNYGNSGTSFGQRPPVPSLPFPQSHYPQNHLLGNKFSSQRFPLVEPFSNSLIPTKHYYPFNPSPPIDPSLLNYYPSHASQFHERDPYPSYPGFPGPSNYPSAFHLGLPKQVKVPGRIEISIMGNDAEITCEFPRYLILMQKIYWHHKHDDPYGSYYDESNGFGPRIRVASTDQWRSVLQIRDFSEDDYGPYRCISAAVLPDDGGPAMNRNLFLNDKQVSTTEATVNSPEVYTDHPYQFETEENIKKSKSNKQKSRSFPNSRKIRFVRDIKNANKIEDTKKQSFSKVERSSESNLIASPEIYDPFSRPHGSIGHPGLFDQTENFPYKYFPNPNTNYISPNHIPPNYYNSASSSTKLPFDLPNNKQNYNYNPNPYHYGKYTNINYGLPSSYGLNAPYYKPKYSIFTVYQDINFAPLEYKPTVNPVGKK